MKTVLNLNHTFALFTSEIICKVVLKAGVNTQFYVVSKHAPAVTGDEISGFYQDSAHSNFELTMTYIISIKFSLCSFFTIQGISHFCSTLQLAS